MEDNKVSDWSKELFKEFYALPAPFVNESNKMAIGIDPYRTEGEFEQFWLETNDYYGMVDEFDVAILKHVHPYFASYAEAKKKVLEPGEYEPFAQFGIGDEYNGILLADWLKEKNMLHFFN